MVLISDSFRPMIKIPEKRPFKGTGKLSFLVNVFKDYER